MGKDVNLLVLVREAGVDEPDVHYYNIDRKRVVEALKNHKGEEVYGFVYEDKDRAETLRMLGRYASDPELKFSWYYAAVLSQKIRSSKKAKELEMPNLKNRFSEYFEPDLLDEDND
jgi:hypothetical protein